MSLEEWVVQQEMWGRSPPYTFTTYDGDKLELYVGDLPNDVTYMRSGASGKMFGIRIQGASSCQSASM